MRETMSHNGQGVLVTPVGLTHDLLNRHRATGRMYWRAVLLLGVLFILGVVGFVLRLQDGFSDTSIWGYHAALFAFILTTAQGGPIVAIATRMAKGHWRRPISRTSELFTAVGVVSLFIFIPLLWVLPDLGDGRRTLWFFNDLRVPSYMPHIMMTLALVALTVCGVALLWLSALPDLAAVRDSSSGRRRRVYARLANGWHGTSRQWFVQHHRLGTVGALYFMMLVFTIFLFSVDFGLTLVPGWIDALFPATQAHNALQAGVAMVLIAMFVLRQFCGYKEHIGLDQFWSLGKLLFALSLLWFWFWFSSFNVLWYGAKPNERAVIDLLMVGPYQPAFMLAFILNFIVPFFAMIWNPLRKSIWGPTLIAVSVLVGTFFDRIRIYVASYSVPGIGDPSVDKHALHAGDISTAVMPGVPDVLIWIGGIAGCILAFMLAAKIFPPVSIWEQKELLLYKVHKPFHRTEVLVLGKPD
jgi:molybdopterin-containing oxidoreductase family membrane subunit